MQRIWVVQKGTGAQTKIDWIQKQGRDIEITRVVSVDPPLPQVIDEPDVFLPATIEADLVLDYSRHPDLTHSLARKCHALGIPMVASGCRSQFPGLFTPPTCCGLADHKRLGAYGQQFGTPMLQATIRDDRIANIEIVRGSPCGSTWKAACKIEGETILRAVENFGLAVQFHCQADPAGWDPIHGKSPVHTAGQIHARALCKALDQISGR